MNDRYKRTVESRRKNQKPKVVAEISDHLVHSLHIVPPPSDVVDFSYAFEPSIDPYSGKRITWADRFKEL